MISIEYKSAVELHMVQVDCKSVIDKIAEVFDGYTNPNITDEIIVDTATINECECTTARAIELFGTELWNNIPVGMVLFHP